MKVSLLVVLILTTTQCLAQAVESPGYSVDQLKQDFQVFQGSLEDFHPGLYTFQRQESMQHIFRQSFEALVQPMTEQTFLRHLAAVATQIGCGHTDVSLSEASEKALSNFLPLKLRFIEEKAFFLKEYSADPSLPLTPGDEIIAIDGIPLREWTRNYLTILTGDGSITTGKYHSLNTYFWYIHTYYTGGREVYELEYRDSIGHIRSASIQALDREAMYERYREEDRAANQENLSLSYLHDPTIAVLTIRSFFDWQKEGKRIHFNQRLEEIFQELQQEKIDRLIIDLRDNGGGKEPWRLFAHFHHEPVTFAKQAAYIYTSKSAYAPYQQLDPSMRWIRRRTLNSLLPGANHTRKLNDSTYALTGLFLVKPFKPLFPQFDGKVVVLTNGGTFSAAALFTSMMHSYEKARFVGEETGGAYHGNNSMNPTIVTLPNTKLRIEIPLVKYTLDVNEKVPLGRGTIPDHEVVPAMSDLLHGIDGQMNKAVELLR